MRNLLKGVTFFTMRRPYMATAMIVSLLPILSTKQALAADLTVATGFYQKSSDKIDGKTAGSSSLVDLGGQFSDDLSSDTAWLGIATLKLHNYTGGGGRPTPDNSVGMKVGGGAKYFFKPFATAVVPYVSGIVWVSNDKAVDWTSTGYSQVATSGLYYGANAGIRAGLGGDFFVELELPIFVSPLFSVETTETVTQNAGTTTKTKLERTETSLHISSVGSLKDAKLGLGMRF